MFRYPLNFIGITQGFSNSHKGIDLGWHKTHNAPVYAAADGQVIYYKFQKTGGNVIHIKHSNGFVSEYAHLKDNSIKVKVGDKVKMGQQIANMGATGQYYDSDAKKWKNVPEHLHLGLCKGTKITYTSKDKWVNPIDYLEVYPEQEVSKTTQKNYGSKIKYHDEKWTKGTYEMLKEKYIRKSPKIANNEKKVKDCASWDKSARDMLTSKKPNDIAKLKIGSKIDITEIIIESNNRIWGRWGTTGNDYICLCDKTGTENATKVK